MRTTWLTITLGALGLALTVPAAAVYAGKKPKQTPHRHDVVVAPIDARDGSVIHVETHEHDGCEHKCCRKRERRCRHECAPPPCTPCIEYKGCPPPCPVEKVVTVTYPKTCCTIELVVQVPAGACERVDRERDGDLELDYGKYEVSIRWRDGGRRLVVDYDD